MDRVDICDYICAIIEHYRMSDNVDEETAAIIAAVQDDLSNVYMRGGESRIRGLLSVIKYERPNYITTQMAPFYVKNNRLYKRNTLGNKIFERCCFLIRKRSVNTVIAGLILRMSKAVTPEDRQRVFEELCDTLTSGIRDDRFFLSETSHDIHEILYDRDIRNWVLEYIEEFLGHPVTDIMLDIMYDDEPYPEYENYKFLHDIMRKR